jgi:hypothetical protein
MGKYKQWLHHQEVGRRLRDQIASLEQERERVQKMAPTHPTTLPELDNPIVSSLIAYTRQGGALNRGADPRAGYAQARMDSDPEPSRPASGSPTTAAPAATSAAARSTVVASLQARADQMPSDPQAQVSDLARARDAGKTDTDTAPTAPTPAPQGTPNKTGDSLGGWWKRYRPDDQA